MGFTDFLQYLVDWFQSGIHQLLTEFLGFVGAKLVIWWIEAKIWSLQLAWGIFRDIATSLNVSGPIQAALSGIGGNAGQLIAFFRVPEAINIMLAALGTRAIFRFLPI